MRVEQLIIRAGKKPIAPGGLCGRTAPVSTHNPGAWGWSTKGSILTHGFLRMGCDTCKKEMWSTCPEALWRGCRLAQKCFWTSDPLLKK
jgi:hypothetical protein